MRWAMGIEYSGTAFYGWQIQVGMPTVQAAIQTAIGRVANHPVTVHCAGRTDTGVHALGQVIHFDSHVPRTERAFVLGCNVNLPPEVSVGWTCPVGEDFHARFSAIARHYRYEILNSPTRSALARNRAVWIRRPLDEGRMAEAGAALVGEHDFSSYRALGCQAKSPVRRVHYLKVERVGDRISLRIGANGFLHHMVRNIAGVLIAIGRGDRPTGWTRELIELRDRASGGVTAPPQGLYLAQVDYPERFALPHPRRPLF